VVTPSQVQQAMDSVPRPMLWPPWWAISTLRPSPPKPQPVVSQRLSVPVSRDIVPDPTPEYPQAISEPYRATERLGVTMQLDVAVERRRSFWWKLVAKLQIFRS
jgi:hypothetical protein